MTRRMTSALIVVLALAIVMSGCSKIPFLNSDAKFAREVLDAVYNGSLASIQDSLGTEMQNPMVGQLIAQVGPQLRQQFGEVKSMSLESDAAVPGAPNMTQQIWKVTAESGSFNFVMTLNGDGKLEGVFATPSSG